MLYLLSVYGATHALSSRLDRYAEAHSVPDTKALTIRPRMGFNDDGVEPELIEPVGPRHTELEMANRPVHVDEHCYSPATGGQHGDNSPLLLRKYCQQQSSTPTAVCYCDRAKSIHISI